MQHNPLQSVLDEIMNLKENYFEVYSCTGKADGLGI